MPAHRPSHIAHIGLKAEATFRSKVKKLQEWIRASGRLPSQIGRTKEERRLACFLNVQQQWMSGRGLGPLRGVYPPAWKKKLQKVPKLQERLREWESLAARRAKLARSAAKPLSKNDRRSKIQHHFNQEVQMLKNWSEKHGRLPVQGTLGEERRLATFLDSIEQTMECTPNPYPATLQGALKQVPGLEECFPQPLRPQKRSSRSSSSVATGAQKRPPRLHACLDPNPKRCRQKNAGSLMDLRTQALVQLRATTFPLQKGRVNVTIDGGADKTAVPQGLSLGINLCVQIGFTVCEPLLKRHSALVQILCQLVKRERPEFTFTSIQVNKSFASALHCDANNLGPSLITCFGEFSGGSLYVHGGGEINVADCWHEFNGNVPHMTCPFKGERYCVIYFTNQSYAKVPAKLSKYLRALGFNWPRRKVHKPDFGPKAPRLLAAAAALPPNLLNHAGPLERLGKLAI